MKNGLILTAAFAALMTGAAGCAVLTPTFKNDLTSTLSAARPQLSKCYADGLARNPKLGGPLTLKLTVKRGTKALTDVTVVGPQPTDDDFEKCVVGVAEGLQIPKAPMLTVRADYPLTFTAGP